MEEDPAAESTIKASTDVRFSTPARITRKTNKVTPKRKRTDSDSVLFNRNRSPSGQFSFPKVDNIIKNYFEAKSTKRQEEGNTKRRNINTQFEVSQSQSVNADRNTSSQSVNREKESKVSLSSSASKQTVNMTKSNHDKSVNKQSEGTQLLTPQVLFQKTLDEHIKKATKGMEAKSSEEADESVAAIADKDTPNPAVIGTVTVINMLQDLKQDLCNMMEKMMLQSSGENQEVQNQDAALQFQENEIQEARKKIDECIFTNSILAGACARQNDIIAELCEKVERLESINAKRMVTITGLKCDNRKHIYKKQVQNFLADEMGLNIEIEDIYKSGTQSELMILTLPSYHEKKLIFQNIYKIKDLANEDGKKVYVNDYFTVAAVEKRRREKDIKDEMALKPPMKKKDISYGKGGMLIGGAPYVKKVEVPDPAKLVQLSKTQITQILSIKLQKGDKIMKSGSSFIAYTCAANSLDTVKDAYMKVKLEHPGARHIAAVWSLPGVNKYEADDFQEDQEYGVGRIMWKCVQDNGLTNRAFYVVRYYGGTKMGNERFDCYVAAMKNALMNDAKNMLTGSVQMIKEAYEHNVVTEGRNNILLTLEEEEEGAEVVEVEAEAEVQGRQDKDDNIQTKSRPKENTD